MANEFSGVLRHRGGGFRETFLEPAGNGMDVAPIWPNGLGYHPGAVTLSDGGLFAIVGAHPDLIAAASAGHPIEVRLRVLPVPEPEPSDPPADE